MITAEHIGAFEHALVNAIPLTHDAPLPREELLQILQLAKAALCLATLSAEQRQCLSNFAEMEMRDAEVERRGYQKALDTRGFGDAEARSGWAFYVASAERVIERNGALREAITLLKEFP